MQFYATSAGCFYGLAMRDEAQAAVATVMALSTPASTNETDAESLARAALIDGQLASSRGEYAKARERYTVAAAAADRGRIFWLRWSALRYLTEASMNSRDWPAARASAQHMVALSTDLRGRDSAERIQASVTLITILRNSGQRAELPRLLDDVEASVRRVREAGAYEIPFYLQTDLDFAAADIAFDTDRDADCAQRADAAIGVLKQHDGYLTNRFNLLLQSGFCHFALRHASATLQRAEEALDIAHQRMRDNHLAIAAPLRLIALAHLAAGDLPQAREALSRVLDERRQAPAPRPVFDLGLLLADALLSQHEGCAVRARIAGALGRFGLAYGPTEMRSNRVAQLLRNELAKTPPPVGAVCPFRN